MEPLVPAAFRTLLPGPLRRFYGATLVVSVGIGLSFVFNVVYVHDIRHHSVAFATGLLAANAVIGLVAAPLIGTATDRFGPMPVFLVSLVGESGGIVLWSQSASVVPLIVASVVMALCNGSLFGPGSVLLTRLVPPEHRQRAYGINFMLLNLGIGLGGLVSASIVRLDRPVTFTVLYLATAAFNLLALVPVLGLRRFGGPVTPDELDDETAGQGWREVLRDRKLLRFVGAAIVMLTCGYGSIDSGLSFFVVDQVHLAVGAVGVTLFWNTATIVVLQLVSLRFLEGRSRTRMMGLVGVCWAVSWWTIGSTVHLGHAVALVVLSVASSIFALGETLWSPVGPALVNDLAPEHLRGRYNAAFGLTWGVSNALAPLIAGLFLGSAHARWWPVAVGAGALVGGGLLTGLRRHLTPAQDGRSPAAA